ncbi:hypothetical protein JCM3766R1_006480 [Sporobolomyces carnicolor]
MCGRFALGLGATELRDQLAREYFREPADDVDGPRREPRARDGREPDDDDHDDCDDGDDREEGEEKHKESRDSMTDSRRQQERRRLEWEVATEAETGRHDRTSESTWRPRYNVAPKSGGVVVRRRSKESSFELSVLRWGLVPHWTKSPQADPPSTINAQVESVLEGRPTWRSSRDSKRCVVVAQGFYEWMKKKGSNDKVPHFIKRADHKLMAFAGLWDRCEYKGEFEPVTTYTIITTPVNRQLEHIHARMPAILQDEDDVESWLSDRPFHDDKVRSVLKPYRGELELFPVDKAVGKVGNDSSDFIKPVSQKAGSLDSMFAKQAASSSPVKREARGTKNRGETIIMNPDEDSESKTERFEESALGDRGERGRSKRPVETIDLVSSSSEDDESAKNEDRKKKRKVATTTDDHGNAKLDRFFDTVN